MRESLQAYLHTLYVGMVCVQHVNMPHDTCHDNAILLDLLLLATTIVPFFLLYTKNTKKKKHYGTLFIVCVCVENMSLALSETF